jgi:hypothetical protein
LGDFFTNSSGHPVRSRKRRIIFDSCKSGKDDKEKKGLGHFFGRTARVNWFGRLVVKHGFCRLVINHGLVDWFTNMIWPTGFELWLCRPVFYTMFVDRYFSPWFCSTGFELCFGQLVLVNWFGQLVLVNWFGQLVLVNWFGRQVLNYGFVNWYW